jgi:hypothetical protein
MASSSSLELELVLNSASSVRFLFFGFEEILDDLDVDATTSTVR